jgi:putative membrane protein
MALLSSGDKERVQAAVKGIEGTTSGEVVVAVVPRSAAYDLWRCGAALLWAVATALLVFELSPALPGRWLLVSVVPLAAAWYLVLGAAPLLARLVPAALEQRAVLAKAFELFAEHGVANTRDRTGVLILVSELERRVVILGDRAVNAAVGPDGWKAEVGKLTVAIAEGRAAVGLLAVLEGIGSVLAERFPRRADDTNELPDRVIEDT